MIHTFLYYSLKLNQNSEETYFNPMIRVIEVVLRYLETDKQINCIKYN